MSFIQPYFLTLLTPPATEPLSLSEAKLHLRIDNTAEDALVARLIAAARQSAEHYARRSFITQSWKLSYDDYLPTEIQLTRGPVQSITSIKTITKDGTQTSVSAANYYLNSGREKLIMGAALLSYSIEVVYVTGYGTAADVPDSIKQGMLAHIAKMYEQRTGQLAIPPAALSLYEPYRVIRL